MYTLYHYPLCPLSRKVRIILSEMRIDYKMVTQKFWVKDKTFQELNPLLTVPFVMANDLALVGSQPIVEFFDDMREEGDKLISGDIQDRAEIRRMIFAFDEKCYHDATKYILHERVYKYFESSLGPNLQILSDARSALVYFLRYLSFILQKRDFIVGNSITMADLSIAAHLSSLDYLGEIKWDSYPLIKHWYSLIKSRPSFAGILSDTVPGFRSVKHYKLLDF